MSKYYILADGCIVARLDDYFEALSAYLEYADIYENVKMLVELSDSSEENDQC